MSTWGLHQAQTLARELIGTIHPRWEHLSTVGRRAENLATTRDIPEHVVAAAWVHDIGYAPQLAAPGTRFHPVDGAEHLAQTGAPRPVVALVAWHTGALHEARTRGLQAHLERLPRPEQQDLDILTLLDLTTGPTGDLVREHDRIAEILTRYEPGHPVHTAVTASTPELLASAARARTILDLATTTS